MKMSEKVVVLVDQLFRQLTSAAFSKDCALGMELHPAFKVFPGRPVLSHAHVASRHTLDAAVLVVENLRGGKA